MTTVNHAAQGYVVCDIAGLPTELCIFGAVAMASNDLHGWYDSAKLIIRTKSLRARDWRNRGQYHRLGLWVYFILLLAGVGRAFEVEGWFIPLFPLVHMGFDWLLHRHGPPYGINEAYIPAEITTGIPMIAYIIWRLV